MPLEAQGLRVLDQNGVPLRIPKLTYRNRVPDSELEAHHGANYRANQGQQPTNTAVRDIPPVVGVDNPTISHSPRAIDTPAMYNGPRRSSASAAVSHSEALIHDSDVKRKKHSSLFGFLSLKEPSTSALEDFARQQKQATARGGRVSAVGMPGTSTQKLPPSIPKVNSKWDGLPSPIREKTKESRNDKRSSTFTVTSRTSISSSSRSSESSSQASLSSGSSVRLTSPTVRTISELPELSDLPANRTGDWARQAKSYSPSGSPLPGTLPSACANEELSDASCRPLCQASISLPEEQSSSVADNAIGLPAERLQTEDGLESGATATKGLENNAIAMLNEQSSHCGAEKLREHPVVDTGQEHAATYGQHLHSEERRPMSSPSYQGASTITEKTSDPSRHQSGQESTRKLAHRAQAPIGGLKADIIPWETESPPAQHPTIPRSEDKEKRKLGFLSRKFK